MKTDLQCPVLLLSQKNMSINHLAITCKDNNNKKQQPPCVTSLDHFLFLDNCFQINPSISSQAKVASNLSN
jgi:hypothetical protein